MTWKPLYTSETGVRHVWQDDGDGGGIIRSSSDVTAVLEHNQAAISHNDGYTPSREMRRVGTIPFALINKWLVEENVNVLLPENADFLMRKLNDPEYIYLRSAPGRLGMSNGVLR